MKTGLPSLMQSKISESNNKKVKLQQPCSEKSQVLLTQFIIH